MESAVARGDFVTLWQRKLERALKIHKLGTSLRTDGEQTLTTSV
jgi:hypothetical protein